MKRFAVIGLGNFGFYAAKALFEDDNEVVAIDTDKARVQAIDPHCTESVVLDATDKEGLKALGLDAMDGVVLSTGANISNSILVGPPRAFIGKSLKDLNLHAKYNVHVIGHPAN